MYGHLGKSSIRQKLPGRGAMSDMAKVEVEVLGRYGRVRMTNRAQVITGGREIPTDGSRGNHNMAWQTKGCIGRGMSER